jgi:hypothetical protein
MTVPEMTSARPPRPRLEDAIDADVRALVRDSVADPSARVDSWGLEPVAYAFGSPNTDGLFRVRATVDCGGQVLAWSVFVKIIRSFRHWPLIDVIPAPMREAALSGSHWRYEADAYLSDLATVLPPGTRLPRLLLLKDLGDERLALVLEDVQTTSDRWEPSTFARAARGLGRLAARMTSSDVLPASASRSPGELTARHYAGRVVPAVLPALADDTLWRHRLLTGHQELRSDMLELADRLPSILLGLKTLPQLMTHGDASPQNLLVPVSERDTFVVVDWTLSGLSAVGTDLGQLLVGLAHAGELSTADLPRLRGIIVDAYTEGLALEGMYVDPAAVAYGLDGDLAVRSALTTLPFERLREPITEELTGLVERRLELTRFLVDLALAMPARPERVRPGVSRSGPLRSGPVPSAARRGDAR